MSTRTRAVPAPGRVARRVQAAERVKSGAAARAYAKRRNRADRPDLPALPSRSVMAGRIPFVAAIIALLGCGLASTLFLTTRAAEDSYQLGDARALNSKLSEERAALQRQVAAADSAPELAARARELGMIPAKDPARLIVAPDGAVTVIGEPTPAQGPPAPPLNGTPTPPPNAPGHAQAQGERVVPVSSVRQPTAQAPSNTQYVNGAQAHTATPAAPIPGVPVPPATGTVPGAVPPGAAVSPEAAVSSETSSDVAAPGRTPNTDGQDQDSLPQDAGVSPANPLPGTDGR